MKLQIALGVIFISAVGISPAHAQDAADIKVSDTVRQQLLGFENTLRGALDSAARNLTNRVRAVWPEQPPVLRFQTEPIVTGVWLPDDNLLFHVQIPAIEEVDLKLLNLRLLRGPSPGTRVSNSTGRVGATGVVEPDAVASAVAPMTNPDAEYTAFTREALYNALLDGALALPVAAGKTLTVIAGELLPQGSNPFVERSRVLILQIRGEDLLALKQDKITRDQARALIKASKY